MHLVEDYRHRAKEILEQIRTARSYSKRSRLVSEACRLLTLSDEREIALARGVGEFEAAKPALVNTGDFPVT